MYLNTAAEIRPELQAVVMDAQAADAYFIASKLFPAYGSATKTGEYSRIKKGSGHLLDKPNEDQLLRAPRTPYKEVDGTSEKDNYFCRDRGLTEVVDDSTQADLARFFDAESVATRRCHSLVLRAAEARAALLIGDKNIWGSLDVPAPWELANKDTIDVPATLKALKRRFKRRGEIANTIQMTEELFDFLTLTKSLREYFFGTQGGGQLIEPEMFAKKFGFAQILLGDAVYSSAKKGKEPTDAQLKYIWPANQIWIGSIVGGPLEAGGSGRNVYWEEDAESEYVVETYRDEGRRSDIVRVRQHSDFKVVNENCGLILDTGFESEV